MTFNFFSKNRDTILYGISLAVLLLLLKWLEMRFVIVNYAIEIYIGAVALIFTGLGIWLALKMAKPSTHTVIVEKEILVHHTGNFILNEDEVRKLGLSKRELEVLILMADGLSNQEIAEKLFVSLNTIKTHSSRVFEKLEVKSRIQAVEKGRKLSIIS